jgi:hypothetical protein
VLNRGIGNSTLGVRLMDNPRRRCWPLLTATLRVPVLYVASFGPAMWISERSNVSRKPVAYVYGPLLNIALDLESYSLDETPPPRIPALLRWWIRVGTRPGNNPTVENGRVNWHYCAGESRTLWELW